MALASPQLWGTHFGPLSLPQYLALPTGSRNFFLKFNGEDSLITNDHIQAFTIACAVLGLNEENEFVRLFVESLIEAATNWFQSLEDGCIIDWNNLKNKFLKRFKSTIDVGTLLSQFFNIYKNEDELMREFVDQFNRCLKKTPHDDQSSEKNQLSIFVAMLCPKIKFLLKKNKVCDLETAKQEAIRIEDDLILCGIWKINKVEETSNHGFMRSYQVQPQKVNLSSCSFECTNFTVLGQDFF